MMRQTPKLLLGKASKTAKNRQHLPKELESRVTDALVLLASLELAVLLVPLVPLVPLVKLVSLVPQKYLTTSHFVRSLDIH